MTKPFLWCFFPVAKDELKTIITTMQLCWVNIIIIKGWMVAEWWAICCLIC